LADAIDDPAESKIRRSNQRYDDLKGQLLEFDRQFKAALPAGRTEKEAPAPIRISSRRRRPAVVRTLGSTDFFGGLTRRRHAAPSREETQIYGEDLDKYFGYAFEVFPSETLAVRSAVGKVLATAALQGKSLERMRESL